MWDELTRTTDLDGYEGYNGSNRVVRFAQCDTLFTVVGKDQNASESSRSPTFSFFSHANAKEYDINMMRYLAGWSSTHVTFLSAPHSYHNGEETVSAGSDRADAAPLQPEIPQNMQIRRHFPLTSNIHLALLPRVSRSFARSRHHTILD